MHVDPQPATTERGADGSRAHEPHRLDEVGAQRLQVHRDQPRLGRDVVRASGVDQRRVGDDGRRAAVALADLVGRPRREGDHSRGAAHELGQHGVVPTGVEVVRVAQVVDREHEGHPGVDEGTQPGPGRGSREVVEAEVQVHDIGVTDPRGHGLGVERGVGCPAHGAVLGDPAGRGGRTAST